jgi:hypothetical protein
MNWGRIVVLAGLSLGCIATLDGNAVHAKTVTVEGQGVSADEAKRDALRRAIEQGAGVELASYSRTENFELIRDTIFSRAEGVVSDYTILEQGEGAGGIYFCKIRADVRPDAVAKEWGEVQNVLDLRGNPKIMVYIIETIDDRVSTSSILESKIEERLIKRGFQVYARQQLDAIAAKEADDAARSGNSTKMADLAKGFGAQIFIMGHANANQADRSTVHGVSLVNYNCDVMAKTYYTDTAKLLASNSLPSVRGGARGERQFSPQAGKMAIHRASEPLIDALYELVMKSWASEITFGGHIDLEVDGVSKVGDVLRLRKEFAAIPGVESVNGRYSNGRGVFRIRATINGEDLAERLVEGNWEKRIELVDYSLNRVQAKWVGGK